MTQRSIPRIPPARRAPAVLVLAALLALAATAARALTVRPMTLDQVIDKSENIFVAVCEAKSAKFHEGNIVTVYKLRPKEFWKGSVPLDKDGTFPMEELGGSLEGKVLSDKGGKVKLGQYAAGGASMVIGEEVLLFTNTYKANAELEKDGKAGFYTPGNQQITGRIFGRFSVLTDDESGAKYVTRINGEAKGIIPSDSSVSGQLGVQNAELKKRLKSGESAYSLEHQIQQAQRKAAAEVKNAGGKAVPKTAAGEITEIAQFEPLSVVKDRVTGFVKSKTAKPAK